MEFLLNTSACLIILYALFLLIFRKFTFHSANRFYLIGSLFLSVIIPSVSIEKKEINYTKPAENFKSNIILETQEGIQSTISENYKLENEQATINWQKNLFSIYLLGVGVFIILFLRKIYMIWSLTRNTKYERLNKLKLFKSKKNGLNASFFNFLFIDIDLLNPQDTKLILAHEQVHFKKLHSLDLLFLEIYKIIFWFNPVVYFVGKSLKEVHEFEVDLEISKNHDRKEYAHLLLKLGISQNSPLLHQLGKKPLSERINFIFKKPTDRIKKLYYITMIPVVLLSIMSFSQQKTVIISKDIHTKKTIEKAEIKVYPLIIKKDKNYTTWGVSNAYTFPLSNISLNHITTVRYNGFNYKVNPNSFTESTISEVNEILKTRNLALIISDKLKDYNGNILKMMVSLKHLKTNRTLDFGVFDMEKWRKEGENGGFFMIDGFDKNFEKSQMVTMFGTQNLLINKSNLNRKNHAIFSINSASSIINHSADLISYHVSPDKFTESALREATAYFKLFSLEMSLESFTKSKNGQLDIVNVSFENVRKSFNLSKMRHYIPSKDLKTRPFRMDETLVFEFDFKTKKSKMTINDSWHKGAKENEAFENQETKMITTKNQEKPIRTIYITNFLGENPLVFINGEEHPSEILTRLNPGASNRTRIYLPNDQTAIEKYGIKAKDGYFEIETSKNYLFTDEKELTAIKELIKKELSVPLARLQKIEFEDSEKIKKVKIKINRIDKISSHFSIVIPRDGKVLYMIDGKEVTEEEIENSNLNFIGGSCGEYDGNNKTEKYIATSKKYSGFFKLKTK
jgi:hypothetical protein